ncbi:MAG: hypothetical protein PF436_00495 [Prolixibacteraceae bacterium]|jgi:hypothetical protein|nr:hypothetical protein [Prolixibacteraceae bacterium]
MKNNLFYIILFVVTFSSCIKKDNEKVKGNALSEKDSLLMTQIDRIKNKEVESLKLILDSTTQIANNIVFLYNGFDCGTCIDIGYEMAKKIDSSLNSQEVYIISTSANVGQDQLRNNYKNYVYIDEKNIIRKELKFIYTPVFLSFDADNRIKNVFFPGFNNRNIMEENSFIRSCIENQKCPK